MVSIDLKVDGKTHDEPQDDHVRKIETFITEENKDGFIYEINDHPVALLMFSIENIHTEYPWPTPYSSIDDQHFSKDGNLIAVFQLWVDPKHRRYGIASQLKAHLELYAVTHGIETLYTHTESSNQHVIELNQKMGYKIVRKGPIWDDVIRTSLIKSLKHSSVSKGFSLMQSVKNGHTGLITEAQVIEFIDTKKNHILIDIRQRDDYSMNPLINSQQVEWEDVHNFIANRLPHKSLAIIVVCYTGQSSMQIATLLSVMGYKAYSLLDGMSSWKNMDYIKK